MSTKNLLLFSILYLAMTTRAAWTGDMVVASLGLAGALLSMFFSVRMWLHLRRIARLPNKT